MLRLTRNQVRAIDRIAIERYHIPGIVLMENAARGIADVACEMLNDDCVGGVLVVCGGGNNGGDGLAAARHLHNRGADVTIALTVDPGKYQGDAMTNWRIAQAMGLSAEPFDPAIIERTRPLLIIDAIFGTGLEHPPRPPFATIAHAINASGVPVLSVDLPSGLDCDTGKPLGEIAIIASRTVTLVAEKIGFANPEAARFLGQVMVADIGCPVEIGDMAGDGRRRRDS